MNIPLFLNNLKCLDNKITYTKPIKMSMWCPLKIITSHVKGHSINYTTHKHVIPKITTQYYLLIYN